MKKKNIKIVILGKSLKFKKIVSSIFLQSDIKVFSWRSIKELKFDEKVIEKKVDLILVCGYEQLIMLKDEPIVLLMLKDEVFP